MIRTHLASIPLLLGLLCGVAQGYGNSSTCVWPDRAGLTTTQRSLLASVGRAWASLTAWERASFLNLTGALADARVDLRGLKLAAIQRDRLMFQPTGMDRLRASLEAGVRAKRFLVEKPADGLHPGMSSYGVRQAKVRYALQVGLGERGAFVDIDLINPKMGLGPQVAHLLEVLKNVVVQRVTDPFKVGRYLGPRAGYRSSPGLVLANPRPAASPRPGLAQALGAASEEVELSLRGAQLRAPASRVTHLLAMRVQQLPLSLLRRALSFLRQQRVSLDEARLRRVLAKNTGRIRFELELELSAAALRHVASRPAVELSRAYLAAYQRVMGQAAPWLGQERQLARYARTRFERFDPVWERVRSDRRRAKRFVAGLGRLSGGHTFEPLENDHRANLYALSALLALAPRDGVRVALAVGGEEIPVVVR